MRYLITGGTGSFGKTMLMSLLDHKDNEIVLLSRDEEKQDALRNKIRDDRVHYRIGDVRDIDSVRAAMKRVDYVFHAAALKQVPSCEFFPMQAVLTNIIGSSNVINAAVENNVKTVVCLSTDKAVFPINAMGLSKAMMERVAQAVSRELGTGECTKVCSVRYGNVMFSRGSVIPLFVKQIKEGLPITLTEPEMTRFLMPLRDSVSLVNFAFENTNQGDLFVQKAAAATMGDLLLAVKKIMKRPDHPVEVIGWRHGEKLYETLASSQEISNSDDLGKYMRIRGDLRGLDYKPYFDEGDEQRSAFDDFHSHNAERLSVKKIEELLLTIPEMQAELSNWLV